MVYYKSNAITCSIICSGVTKDIYEAPTPTVSPKYVKQNNIFYKYRVYRIQIAMNPTDHVGKYDATRHLTFSSIYS